MRLIGISILVGIICCLIGGTLGGEFYAYIGGVVGFLSPGLYVLDEVYKQIKKSK
jgi:hypothetical protein